MRWDCHLSSYHMLSTILSSVTWLFWWYHCVRCERTSGVWYRVNSMQYLWNSLSQNLVEELDWFWAEKSHWHRSDRLKHNTRLIPVSHFCGSKRSSLQFYKYFCSAREGCGCLVECCRRFTFWLWSGRFLRGLCHIFAASCGCRTAENSGFECDGVLLTVGPIYLL